MRSFITSILLTAMVCTAAPVGLCAQSHGIEAGVVADQPAMTTRSGGIEITVPAATTTTFYIFSITGQLVKTVDVSESAFVELHNGCYIVKCAQWSKKVVVK